MNLVSALKFGASCRVRHHIVLLMLYTETQSLPNECDHAWDARAEQQESVAVVAHEFRRSLAVIIACSDNLRLSLEGIPDSTKLRINRIAFTARRMSMLIENILTEGRLRDGAFQLACVEAIEIGTVLEAVNESLEDAAAARIRLISCDAVVNGDRSMLEIALQNLIQNALRYSPPTSPVTVMAHHDGSMIYIYISDFGSGILSSDADLIFNKYYRSSNNNSIGSGLGLYISRKIARLHGGNVTLSSSDVSGSTFCLRLPLGSRSGSRRAQDI